MAEFALSDLDFHEIGEWPPVIKLIATLLLCVVTWSLGYYFLIADKNSELTGLEQQEVQLKKQFEVKQQQAANLASYKKQTTELRAVFATMLKQLPITSEVPNLLKDIASIGRTRLEFQSFTKQDERPGGFGDFYVELPISMVVTGQYHHLGWFASAMAALPRIVTIHNLTLKSLDQNTGKITISIAAKTYRYLDEQPELVEYSSDYE